MPNPRLAGRYAKSLIGLANEKNQLEQVYSDMLYLQELCKVSRDFTNLLKSPVIHADKKLAIIKAVTGDKTGEMTNAFIRLLVNKGREENLPEISTAFIDQYKTQKGIYTVKLTTASPVSDELRHTIIEKVKSQTQMKNIELKAEVDADIIGGFVLQIGDQLVDASIAYDLSKVRSQFLNNDFIYKIR